VQGALAEADAAGAWEEVRILRAGEIRVPLAQAHLPFTLLGAFPGVVVAEQSYVGEEAALCFECPPDLAPVLEHAWQERSRGGVIHWD
jgi:hypothetical protein